MLPKITRNSPISLAKAGVVQLHIIILKVINAAKLEATVKALKFKCNVKQARTKH